MIKIGEDIEYINRNYEIHEIHEIHEIYEIHEIRL